MIIIIMIVKIIIIIAANNNNNNNNENDKMILKASRGQDSSERHRALSCCNHLAQDTDLV